VVYFFQVPPPKPHNIGWVIQITKLLIIKFFPFPVTSSLLGPNILLNTLFSYTLGLRFFLNVSDKVSHPYKTTDKIIVLYILIFKFWVRNIEDKKVLEN
jgi:hypothetical protein